MKDKLLNTFIIKSYIDNIIVEGNIEELKLKYSERISKDKLEEILAIDFTPTKKYFPWLLKVLSQEGVNDTNLNQLRETEYGPGLIKIFDKILKMNKLQGIDNDIFSYKTIESLYDKLKHYVDFESLETFKSKTEKEKEIKQEGSKVVYRDEYLDIIWIIDKCSSDIYGAGTKWCISATNPAYKEYFNKYKLGDKKNIYMFIFKPFGLQKFPEINENNFKKVVWLLGRNHSTDTMWDEVDVNFYEGEGDKLSDFNNVKNKRFKIFYNILKKINPNIVKDMKKPIEQVDSFTEVPKIDFIFKPRKF